MKFFLFLLSLISFTEDANAMAWGIENGSHEKFNILFDGEEKEINLIISCDERSFLSLDDETKTHFTKVRNEYRYSKLSYSRKTESKDKIEEAFPEDQKLVCRGNPKDMSVPELAKIIKTQKVIFYTGAGISAGAVPTMNELMSDLGMSQNLKEGKKLQKYVSEIIKNPDHYIKILYRFFDRCENARPSIAHIELAKMVRFYGHLLVTENLDQLHQKTKLEPIIFPGAYENRGKVESCGAMNASFVITIGLNSDECGFLKWYKERNPAGRIVSINLIATCYLSDDDFIIKGDAQKIMEQIGKMM